MTNKEDNIFCFECLVKKPREEDPSCTPASQSSKADKASMYQIEKREQECYRHQ